MRRARFNIRYSISGKLTLTFLLIAVLFIVLVSSSISHVFRTHFESNLRPHLIQYMEYVQSDIGIPVDRTRAMALAKRLNIVVHIIDSQGTWSSTGKLNQQHKLDIKHKISQHGIDYGIATLGEHEFFMSKVNDTRFLFDIPNLHPKHRGRGLLPIAVLLLLYHFTHRIIRPISILKSGVIRIGNGELDHRIKIKSHDELGDLANSINDMTDDIEKMLTAKRQLLLAISHELRSPLTRAKVSLELLDDATQKDLLHEDLDEMEKLLEELLETERLSTNHSILNMHNTNLNCLVKELLDDKFVDTRIDLLLPDNDVFAYVDPTRIKLMLKNLLENAVRHTPEDAEKPSIKLTTDKNILSICITDFGSGIDEHHVPHITEAFYRADSSRQRDTGGYGLGLYLCRVIAEAHKGRLFIESKINKGTTITIVLSNNEQTTS